MFQFVSRRFKSVYLHRIYTNSVDYYYTSVYIQKIDSPILEYLKKEDFMCTELERFHFPMLMELSVYNRHYVANALTPIAKENDLKMSEVSLLLLLYLNPSVKTAKEIACLGELKRGNISVLVESLSKRGLISQVEDVEDRRKKTLELTSEASGIIESCKGILVDMLKISFNGIPEDELKICEKVFMKMYDNMKTAFGKELYR